jgi:hypothetical protein
MVCSTQTLQNTKLTLKEVAQELECEEMDVKTMIRNNQLKAEQNDFQEWLVEKRDLQKFKIGGIRNWIHTGAKMPVAKAWSTSTPEERQRLRAGRRFKFHPLPTGEIFMDETKTLERSRST